MTQPNSDNLSPHIESHQTERDKQYYQGLEEYFAKSIGTDLDKLRNFPKFVPRPDLNRFLAKNEIFKKILTIHGSVVECGVFLGGGLLTWAQLSSIYEPLNHIRHVIGFDTFEGFAGVHIKDKGAYRTTEGALAAPAYQDLQECIRLYDMARPLGHIPRVELVAGNAIVGIPQYLNDNPHLVVSLLYLDFDIYEPTRVAIELFLPRMPNGAVIAFDELNVKHWPGETQAVLDTLQLRNLRVRRFPFQPQISYAVLR